MGDSIGVVDPNGTVLRELTGIDDSLAMRMRLQENRDRIRRELTGIDNSNSLICIYRVPQSLIGIGTNATASVKPELVSIGPYHRQKLELLEFEGIKLQFLDAFLSRAERNGTGPLLEHFFEAAKQLEEQTRRCYDESITMSRLEFCEMMVLDGCFIIELFRHKPTGNILDELNIPTITRDLLKLENQLPFFVLERFFSLSSNPDDQRGEFLEFLALDFFNLSFPSLNVEAHKRSSEFKDVKHLLDLFHSFCLPIQRSEPSKPTCPTIFQIFKNEASEFIMNRNSSAGFSNYFLSPIGVWVMIGEMVLWVLFRTLLTFFGNLRVKSPNMNYRPSSESIKCATLLKPSGIKFKPLRSDSFLLIHFKDNVLEIPPITINDLNITAFVNCLALEQCNYQHSHSYFTTYIAFLSCLIQSSTDVALLSASGIISSNFTHNDHDIAALFRKLEEKVYFDQRDCYLSQQFRDLETYYKSPRADLIRTYFSSPWTSISVLTAFVILLLTITQTVLSILSYRARGS